MTTLIIDENIKLSKTHFKNFNELVEFIDWSKNENNVNEITGFEIEYFTKEETDRINNLPSVKRLREKVKTLKFN